MSYRYYSTQRPVGPGTFPQPAENRVIGIHNDENRTFYKEIGRAAWGYIDYEKPLAAKDAENYELMEGNAHAEASRE